MGAIYKIHNPLKIYFSLFLFQFVEYIMSQAQSNAKSIHYFPL